MTGPVPRSNRPRRARPADPHPDDAIEHIMVNVRMLAKRCKNLVIVANELGGDGVSYGSGTQLYQVVVGSIACALAGMSDVVVEVAAGQPRVLKGELS